MPHPNQHDQPAEGGVEAVEHTLQKQSEPKPAKRPNDAAESDRTPRNNKSEKQR